MAVEAHRPAAAGAGAEGGAGGAGAEGGAGGAGAEGGAVRVPKVVPAV